MASALKLIYRNRTREFLGYRNSRPRRGQEPSRHFDETSDKTPLVEGGDIELGNASSPGREEPPWVIDAQRAQDYMKDIMDKIKDLERLHERRFRADLNRDEAMEEQEIELATKEITRIFHTCQHCVQLIGRKCAQLQSPQQERLGKNAMQSLAGQLQELSGSFRKSQSQYLKRLRNEERRRAGQFGGEEEPREEAVEDDDDFSEQQQSFVRQNTALIREREEEITKIVQSITELSEIFKELSVIIVDQGTILDRIDYNLEQAAYHVDKGKDQLIEGEKYQKKATKKMVIIFLVLVVVAFIFVMIFHSKHK